MSTTSTETIPISPELLRRFEEHTGATDASTIAGHVARLIEREIETGYEKRDHLTGCGSHYALHQHVLSTVLSTSAGARVVQNFLCCDIESFSAFLDRHGYVSGDEVLATLGKRLRDISHGGAVFRHGGDEFVVSGLHQTVASLDEGLGVRVKQSIVAVDVAGDRTHPHRVVSWIMLHLHMGVVKATLGGSRIQCSDRPG